MPDCSRSANSSTMPCMIRVYPFFVVMCLLVPLAVSAAGGPTLACVKSVRWDDTPPFNTLNAKGEVRGLHADLVREALARLQCGVRFVEMPWARSLIQLQSGKVDMVPGAADLKEREAYARFSRPTNSSRNVLFVRNDAASKYQLKRLTDIIGTDFRLAVERNASLGTEFDELVKTPAFASRLTYVSAQKSGLRMMALGRVDGQITGEVSGLYAMDQLGLGTTLHQSKIVTSTEADFVAFSKATTDEAFVKRFNAALGAMMADGTYRRILERYLNCPVSVEKLGCQ